VGAQPGAEAAGVEGAQPDQRGQRQVQRSAHTARWAPCMERIHELTERST
jgi:hypothetical protein